MGPLSLMFGLTSMLITPVLVFLYVAFMIAVFVCRSIDWFCSSPPREPVIRPLPRS